MWNRFSVRQVIVRATALCLAAGLLAAPASAQSFYGSLIGAVKDAQGAVIPGATVVVVNAGTNERHQDVSSEDGSYRFVNLVPGTYRLEVELQGFQRYVRDGIQVNVQSTPRIDATLQLGNISETVQVTGAAPLLQAQDASVASVVGSRAVQELPLNGRNVLNLIAVAPTVVSQGGAEGSLTGKNVFAAGNYQIGGGVANQSASLYDGVPLQDTAYGNIVVLTPSPEAVEEFRVQTNNSSAEFGRFTGGVVNITSRSGSNAFHGSMFEYNRNQALNSNTFFGKRAGLEKPPFVQNNFGGVLGGPALKNKLFFFGSYEGYRNREGVLFRRTVPTAAMKAGDFSDYRNLTTGAVVPIYDPWTQCGITNPGSGAYNGDCGVVPNRLQFPGNIIPQNRISPIAKKYLAFPAYPDPTVAGPWKTENWEHNAQVGGNNDQVSVRGDYNLSQNQRVLGRYTRFESTNLSVDLYGNGQRQGDPYSPEHFITTQMMAAHTYTLNSRTVLDVRFGYLHWDYDRTPGNMGTNLVQTLGLPKTPYGEISERSGIPGMETLPTIGAGSNSFVSTGLLLSNNRSYSVTPTLTKLAGDHTLKMGGNFLMATEEYFQNNSTGGTFTFSANPTALDGTSPGSSGDPFASFMLGIPTGGTYQSSGFQLARTKYQGYFIDDSWQLNSKLTLTLGGRWEIPGVFSEKNDRLVTFNPNAVNPLLKGLTNPVTGQPYLGAFELAKSAEQPSRGLHTEPFNRVVPRVGFAYRIGKNTVVRGGAGTFVSPSTVRFQDGVNGPLIQRTNTIVTSVDSNKTFFTDISNPFPNGVENFPGRDPNFQRVLLGGTASQFYKDEPGYPGYSHQWNVAVQHEFQNSASVEVTYSGLDGNHLANTLNFNQLGREFIDRAANDKTICSLTGNEVIPEGSAGYVAAQRDTCYGAYLRQLVTNPFNGLIREGSLSTPTIQRSLLLVKFPEYGSANRPGYFGSSRYHALAFRAEKRFAGGSLVSGHYTFSKNMTNTETLTNWLESGAGNASAGYQTNDLNGEWSLSSFDVRHRFVLNYVMDLPFGEGRKFGADAPGVLRTLMSGWRLNGVVTLQSGFPLAFTATPNLIASGYNLRPNVVPNCDKKISGSALDRMNGWFNTSCFTVPNAAVSTDPGARWQLGNEPRVDPDLRAQGINNWNLAISKSTPLQGHVNLTLRAEAFNLFNRTQFGPPNTTVTTAATSTLGKVTSQNNQPRLMQIAFKLTF
jgi:hypothetical protein